MSFPDPAASLEALSIVNKILDIHIDLKQLREEAERIKISTRELMLLTERALKETQRLQEGRIQTIYR
jgi:predicted ATP-grasp superfamily ATP-dependent carboligase